MTNEERFNVWWKDGGGTIHSCGYADCKRAYLFALKSARFSVAREVLDEYHVEHGSACYGGTADSFDKIMKWLSEKEGK